MNLGFILFRYFPFGGLQRDCLSIAQECARRGHAVTIFTRTWQGNRPGDIAVETLGCRGITNIARDRNFVKQLTGVLAGKKLDGVIGFNKMPGLDVYYGADPCYATKPGRWTPRARHFRLMEESIFAAGRQTQILLLTPRDIPSYRQFYGTEEERFHVLPPSIARRSFSENDRLQARRRIREEFGWRPDEKLLLFVGSGFRTKGLDRAIAALSSLDGARLVVIGQNKPGRFGALARRSRVASRVHFLGGRGDVPEFMLAADVLVHPAYAENTGTVLLEAMTCGLPVLSTDVCGYAGHIENAKAGIVLASPFNQQACEAALAAILEPGKAEEFRGRALRYAAAEDLYSGYERAAQAIERIISEK